jgi:hypothetical protein
VSIDVDDFNPDNPEIEVIQLMHHIASGEPSMWAIYAQNGYSQRFDTYQEASAKFDELPVELYPQLRLWTRIGTSVRFRYKEPGEETVS